ncbi:MAG: hypothetical protein QM802_04020 [Agriterribacter sp.]
MDHPVANYLFGPEDQTDTALNPVETFSSGDFQFPAAVDWDVSKGGAGAVIIETGTQQATGLEHISVRYDTASATKNATDTVQVQAISGGETRTKFRTIFSFTPRAVNTSNPLDAANTKVFDIKGGTTNLAEVHTPADASDWFMAKAEIIFDVAPKDMAWSSGGAVGFVTGAPAGTKGNIVARRETKFTKGDQANGTANRNHTDQVDFISAGDSADNDMQAPTNAAPNALFRLANEGFDPANLLQGYLRADYRDYLEFNDGNSWVRISDYAEWFANLTGSLNTAPPPGTGTPNNSGTGANAEKVPNQKPTLVPVEAFREIKPGEVLTLAVTPTDADNDKVNGTWTQTAGPAANLSTLLGLSTVFTAPAGDFQFKFSVTGSDDTELLSRNAGNFKSDPVEIIVNVVEWKNTGGGDPQTGRNITEVFDAANFGIGAGPLNWDVTTGGIAGVIIEADGAIIAQTGTVNGATTIKVRYDNASGDLTRAQTVIIQATHQASGKSWLKRRTVFRITVAVQATDTHTHLIPSTLVAAGGVGADHFCTAQGQGDTILQATFVPAPTPADIDWQGTGAFTFTIPGIGADRTTAKISSNTGTGQDIPFTVRIAGDTCYSGRYWTIWTSVVQTITPLPSGDPVTYTATTNDFSRSIRNTYTIQPATIISANPTTIDIPDLTGANQNLAGNTVNPPDVTAADVGVANNGAGQLSGGADHKWDVSRQIRRKAVDISHIANTAAASAFFFTTFLNYPSNPLAGNDDQGTSDEDNDPYVAGLVLVGQICADDSPTRKIQHIDGSVNETFEVRNHFREFARLLLDTQWYAISGFATWRLHFLGVKRSENTDGRDYDGDGKQDKTFWVDNGTVIDLTNNGF